MEAESRRHAHAHGPLLALVVSLLLGTPLVAAPAGAPTDGTSADAPRPPALRLERAVTPAAYRVELTLVPAREAFSGSISIDLDFHEARSIVWLNATEIAVDRAVLTVDGTETPVRVVPGGEDFLGFAFNRPVGPGAAVLTIDYRGKLYGQDTSGLFHQQEGDDWYVFSQFESIYARRAFPCFDEPSFKVSWRLALTVPQDLVAVANTPAVSETPAGEGLKRVEFAPTKPLPSYLVALGVGPFDVVDLGVAGAGRTPLRIVALKGRGDQTRWTATVIPEILERLEAYFGIPYPYAKLDALTIPQTVAFGAMENAGLITYVESLLLATPPEETVDFKRRAARVIAHEMAHQWFGDLVTMAWWDDIWLNESFATWMTPKVVGPWQPGWDEDVRAIRSRSRAMDGDVLATARKIRQEIASKDDILNAFDNISYGKGAAILSMFESWMGEAAFREGVHRYLENHRFGNATAADFLAALDPHGTGVAAAFDTFLDQSGVPVVSVALHCDGGADPFLELAQERLLPLGSKGSNVRSWELPVCVRYGAGSEEARACEILREPSGRLALDGVGGCPDWVLVNDGEVGYYRALYGGDLLERLLDASGPRLSVAETVGLLGDVKALAEAGKIPLDRALALVPRFADGSSRHLVAASAAIAEGIRDDLVPEALRPSYARFLRENFGATARRLGFVARPGEDDDTRLLRQTVVGLVALDGEDPELDAEAARLARAWLEDHQTVDADMRGTVLRVAARFGDAALLDRYLESVHRETKRRDRQRILSAMGSFRDPEVERRALATVLDENVDFRETVGLLFSSLGDPATREIAWTFFTENFEAIHSRMPREMGAFLPFVASGFCSEADGERVRAFFTPYLDDLLGARRSLAQTLERIDLCAARRAAQLPSVEAFLTAR